MRWFILFCIALTPLAAAERPDEGVRLSDAIGVETFNYTDPKRDRPVTVEFWFPTQDKRVTAESESLWAHPKECRGAPIAPLAKKLPLIVMSHGSGGSRRDQSWLAEALVKGGYAVASVDHHGNTTQTLDTIATLKFWDRPRDVSFALDRLLDETVLQGRIDPDRIGFVGYSLGGMTGLALAGAMADQVEVAIEKVKQIYPELTPDVLKQVDLRPIQRGYFDSRIKAFMLLAPANFIYSKLKSLRRPIALVVSPSDDVLPFRDHFEPMIEQSIPVRLKLLPNGASHAIFLNRASEKGRKILKDRYYIDPPGVNRSEIHREVSGFALDFFRTYLSY